MAFKMFSVFFFVVVFPLLFFLAVNDTLSVGVDIKNIAQFNCMRPQHEPYIEDALSHVNY